MIKPALARIVDLATDLRIVGMINGDRIVNFTLPELSEKRKGLEKRTTW